MRAWFKTVSDLYRRARHFLTREIWDQRLDELPPAAALRYRVARVVQRLLEALILGDALHVRAAALTYFTVLSLVPLLAFVFALLKGFGAYDALVDGTIRPYALNLFSANRSLHDAIEQIFGFVTNTDVTSLGLLGLLTLLYAATRLLRNIESALNQVWDIPEGRDLFAQFRDYILIIAVIPISLIAAAGLTTAGQALRLLEIAGKATGLSNLLDQLLGVVGPLVVLFLALLLLYKVMPCTKVKLVSAMVGAAVGALLWYAVLIAHLRFQVGVARFNALYSGFAAIPIFLAWLQISWLVVLLGAQVAATHQNGRLLAQRVRLAGADHRVRESIAIAAMLRIGGAFMSGERAPSILELGTTLDVPQSFLRAQLERLARAGLLELAGAPDEQRYVLARAAESIELKTILDAVRGTAAGSVQQPPLLRVDPVADRLWQSLDATLRDAPANCTLRDALAR